MRPGKYQKVPATVLLVGALLLADSAQAFRCKSKLVTDGMHEQQVIAICGKPTTRRNIGVAQRSYEYGWIRSGWGATGLHRLRGPAYLSEEVVVTEFTYNFGPRKLMRRLVFEGGTLVSIETIGYGYNEK
ncbi:MAG TPA: DUF2845 domain-containing protein [Woeseiaceae bacterium]|nr:DUF2845 domain-containing protein [Woeseiaceae bacterium]